MSKSNQWVVPRERSGIFCKSATSVIYMYLHEIIIFRVQNCSFLEMIISDNTEWGNNKLTRCSCWKKVNETENLSAKECCNTKQNLRLSWSFLLLICNQAFYVFFLQFAAGSILLQFKVIIFLEIHHTHSWKHCLTHLNKTACEIWSVLDKVHFWVKKT